MGMVYKIIEMLKWGLATFWLELQTYFYIVFDGVKWLGSLSSFPCGSYS
jgi:hypothetical protein